MASKPHSDDNEGRLLTICQQLCMGVLPLAFARHIVRVIGRITPSELEQIDAPHKVVEAFRSKGLIPPEFIALCATALADAPGVRLSAEALAVCFAAAAFPQRAHQNRAQQKSTSAKQQAAASAPQTVAARATRTQSIKPSPTEEPGAENSISETMLRRRLEAFAQLVPALVSFAPDKAAEWLLSTGRLPEVFTLDETKQLLTDLTATDSVKASDRQREIEARICGAAFYLASCDAESVTRICANWRAEASLVRGVRRLLMAPPSEITQDAQYEADYPLWTRIRARLQKEFPDALPELFEHAIIMEQSVWKQARERKFGKHEIPDLLASFWAAHHNKLIAGFPYYAFRSRFVRWWKQCAINWWIRARKHAFEPLPPALLAQPEITPPLLRSIREGYRLVRTTLFKRERDNPHGLSPAAMIEHQRHAADDIFYDYIAEGMDEPRLRARLKDIAARYPVLGEDTINDLSARIRVRMKAYLLGRSRPWSNAKIGAEKCASQRRGAGRTLGREPGVFTLTTLARLVPEERTLLWAFTAHVFLRSQVDPQHADPWSFARYLRELWWWLRDDEFAPAVQRGAATGSRVDAVAWSMMQAPPFADLLATLKSFQTETEVQQYLIETDLHSAEACALKQVEQLIGDATAMAEIGPLLRAWRRQAPLHWIVPMWYLVFIERLGERAALDSHKIAYRLMVDPEDVGTVVKLYNAMASHRRKTTSR